MDIIFTSNKETNVRNNQKHPGTKGLGCSFTGKI